MNEGALADYFDANYHSAAVIGVNTSAMIDAAFAGRGVYTLLARRFQPTQEGMLHFGHLLRAGGGLVHATRRVDDHVDALARAVRGEDAEEAATRAEKFLADFIRPHGLDQPATPRLADASPAGPSTRMARCTRRRPRAALPHSQGAVHRELEGRSSALDARRPQAKPPSRSA